MTIGIVVGNPKPRSRTRQVAEALATAVAAVVGLTAAERMTVDLAELGPLLFDQSSTRVRASVEGIRRCSLVVVASPTYKATYTGLLKSYLDWFSSTDLVGVTAVPLMVGAAADHALAVEVHLRPVLVELGATLPTRGLYVTEPQLEMVSDVITAWLQEAAPRLRAVIGAPRR
jgi:FMN reductase